MFDKSFHTSIQCLTAIAQHHGLQINPEWLIQEYAIGEEEPNDTLLLRIATDIGLKAKYSKLSWDDLLAHLIGEENSHLAHQRQYPPLALPKHLPGSGHH